MTYEPKTFGLTLKQAHLNKGMTQEQLAEIFGVTNRTISRWEHVNLPDYDLLLQISTYFEIPVNEILTGEKNTSTPPKKWYQKYYASMNEFNYYTIQIIFNILNIIVVTLLYNHDAFGLKTIDFSIILKEFFRQITVSYMIFFIIPLIFIIIFTVKKHFQNIKNYNIRKIIHINLVFYHMIFVPILLILVGLEVYLYSQAVDSSSLVAFCCLFSNMVVFHMLYVNSFHKYVDRLWTHKKNS